MTSELLLEIRCDPIPPDLVEAGTQRLKNQLVSSLRAVGVAPKQSATGFTGKRMLVLFRGVAMREPSADAASDKIASKADDDLETRVSSAVKHTIESLTWPRTMTWELDYRWASPIRAVLLLLDGERVPATIFGRETVDWTLGSESSGAERIPVKNADGYGQAMAEAGIEVRYPERRRRLLDLLAEATRKARGELLQDASLLKARAVSCETPSVVAQRIDSAHQKLPQELVQECIRDRLAGFCIVDKAGLPKAAAFVIDRWDDPDGSISKAYGWALNTYLDDVAFFLDRDRRLPLAERCRELNGQTLSSALGSYGQRAQRCVVLCDRLCDELGWQSERDRAKEAIKLLAADARTELLRAFPALEGVIGGLLAREEGYATSVWQAIADSRRTALDSRSLPRGRVGKLVALADRLDRVAAVIFETATECEAVQVNGSDSSSSDSEVLELLSQMIRIGLGGGMSLDIRLLCAFALRQRLAQELSGDDLSTRLIALLEDLNASVELALTSVFQESGYSDREIAAVLNADGSSLLSDQQQRLEGLRSLRGDQRLMSVAHSAKRISGILQGSSEQKLDVALLKEGSERDLYFVFRRLVDQLAAARSEGAFANWLQQMNDLNDQVERFLREVLVRDENERLRQNRLALLQRVHWLYAGELRLAELIEES